MKHCYVTFYTIRRQDGRRIVTHLLVVGFFFPTISSAIAVRCILFLRNSSTIVQILNTMLLIQILVFYGTVIPVTSDKACDVCHCNGTRVDCRALSLKEIPTDIPNNTTWL